MKYLLALATLAIAVSLQAQSFDIGSSTTHAVVVGISDYQDKDIPDLRFADRDAEAFANYLRSPAGGSLDGDHLKVLIDSQATVAQFAIALDWLMEVTKEGDEAIIYFSGHGDVEKKTLTQPGFLLCWDAPARVYMAGGAFNLRDVQEIVSTLSIQNKAKVVVITDACRSGTLAGNTISGAQATAANLAKQYANEIKILSCQPNEYSIEGEQWGGGRGAFSFNLLDALYGLADGNNDLFVTLQEVGRYLEDHVTAEVAPVSQVPMVLGNRTERLATVNAKLLAAIRSGKTSQMAMLSPIESRGLEEDVLAAADTTVRELYRLFKKALKEKVFLEPLGTCANDYYERLIQEPKLARLHSTMRRNFAAALQDDAQQVMNTMLKTGLTLDVLSGKKAANIYQEYPALLDRASALLGNEHYMYAILQARKSFFLGKIQPTRLESRRYYQKALELQPDLPHAFVELVSTFSAEEVDSAEICARKAMEIVPRWVVPYIRLSNFYEARLKNVEKAEAVLDEATKVDSNSVLVWYQRANFYKYHGDFEKAVDFFRKAIAKTSSEICFNCALVSLGDTYIRIGRFKEAEVILLKAIQMDSTFGGSLNRLGKVYWNTGKFKESEEAFKKELLLTTNIVDRTEAYNELGNLYIQMNRLPEAEENYKKSIACDSTFNNPYFNLSLLYSSTGRWDEAELYCKKTIQLDSTISTPYIRLGLVYARSNKWVEAEFYGKKGIRLGASSDNYYDLACLYSLINKLDEAFEMLEKDIIAGDYDYTWMNEDADLAPLREQKERWKALMKKYFPDQFKD